MILVDTHCHLYEPEFDADREAAFERAVAAGVERMLLPAIDMQSHERLFDLVRAHADRCRPMMGLHPTSVNDNPRWREELAEVERLLAEPPAGGFCGVGEIGLDFYWSSDFRDEQTEALRRQLELALRYDLPVAIHTREAWPEMTAVIESFAGRGLRGVFHAFSGDAETWRRLRVCGDFCFGIGGVVTYKKSAVAAVVAEMPLGEMVLETDCPYLSPVPHRGERNEPAYVADTCRKVAEIKGIDPGETAAVTTANACRMFGLSIAANNGMNAI